MGVEELVRNDRCQIPPEQATVLKEGAVVFERLSVLIGMIDMLNF